MKKFKNSDFAAYDVTSPNPIDGASLSRKFRDAVEFNQSYFGMKLDNGKIIYVDVKTESLETYLREKEGIWGDKDSGARVIHVAAGNSKDAIEKELTA